MPRQDTLDFLTAFAVGTVLGVGATLLLQPDQSPKARVARQLKPYRKQLRRSYKEMSRGLRDGSEATSEMTSEVIGAGRELLGDFRAEVSEILDQARAELGDIIAQQAKELRRGARQTRRKIGL